SIALLLAGTVAAQESSPTTTAAPTGTATTTSTTSSTGTTTDGSATGMTMQSTETNQSTSGWAQEATRPGTLFPVWHMQSTRTIDPRIRPNAGIRVPRNYYPLPGGPLLYHNYSAVEPDFLGGQATNPWAVRVSLGLFGVEDDKISAKFAEFRDVRSGMTAGVDGHFRQDNTIFNIWARQIGRKDQDVAIDGGEAGSYYYSLNYNETPHNYMFDAKSLWSGVGSDALRLPDGMQRDLQNSANQSEMRDKLLAYISSGAEYIDESLHRQTLGGDFTLLSTYPFVLKLSASNESRQGIRPWSGSFGFGSFVEMPWPVDYDTHEVRLSGEWAKPESPYYANAQLRVSDFVDHIQSFTFDNPFRIQDAAGGLNCTFNCGPALGRMSLYPSNKYYEGSATFVAKKLPWNSTFNAFASVGFMRQNEELLPFSTNSADPPLKSPVNPSFNATDPAGLPRSTAETAMNTQTVQLRWTSDLNPKARLTAQYRFYGLDNNEKQFTMFQFVREDQDIRNPETAGGTYMTVPADYSKHTMTLEGTWQLTPMSKLSGVYTFERMNREFREIKWSNDNKFKVEYDTTMMGALEFKTWYERTQRTTSDYDFDQYNIVQGNPAAHPMFPWLIKFDESPYGRNELQGMVTWALSDTQSLSGHLQFVNTDYNVAKLAARSMTAENVKVQTSNDEQFGVRWDRRASIGLDYTWSPTEKIDFFAEAGYEKQQYESQSRQWTVNGISDPYLRQPVLQSNSNWKANSRDNYMTAGLGMDAQFIPDKLKLSLQYVFAKSDGRQSYSSPLGTAATDDVNLFVPQPFDDVDDTTTHSLNPELTYTVNDHLSLAAGYQWEKWTINDYNYKGFTYAPLYVTGVAMLMGGILPPSYDQNIAYVRVRMGF
ncbi:MAG: MtrB/PioB family outer membrane beta-barrel protein, partial [Acidobacteria bacterium]|nr:MtrB/PioB family outer membrane beta-barrel protein [Acidobacteriota bacterium]